MISDEYLEMIRESIEPIKELLPECSKLLLTPLYKEISLEYMDSEELMQNIEKGKRVSFGSYVECYSLVNLCGDNTSIYEPLKKELIVEVPELVDFNIKNRTKALENWLKSSDDGADYFCDHFTEEILPSGWNIFVPNRVPKEYDVPGDNCSFISVF